MERLLVAIAIALVAAAAAAIVARRRAPDAPTQRRYRTPEQIDRRAFPRPEAPWIVVVFSSATCAVCRTVAAKAEVMESEDVAVVEVAFDTDRRLHEQYGIDAVPTTVIADAHGVVAAAFLGPVTATDLWAAMAEARDPGSTPGVCAH